ncbi:hypothetical protein L0F63_001561 [Massospora cicadina]|nr:hypothetical protein L0F63_001561 [Massospora cicadina]
MDSGSTIFVDGTPSEQALEFAGLIDQIQEVPEGSTESSFAYSIQSLIDEENWDEIYTQFAARVTDLLKLEDNKIIPGFTLFLVQLKAADSKLFPTLVKGCIDGLVGAENQNGYAKLAMLETLYNAIDNAELKGDVLIGIVNVASKHNIVKSLLNITSVVKSKAFEAINVDFHRKLYIMLHMAFKESFGKQAYECLLSYLYTFKDAPAETLEFAKQAIVDAISTPEVLNFEPLTQTPPVQALSGQAIHELANIFLDGDVASYLAFTKEHSELANTFDQVAGLHKIRLLTVASLGAKHIGSPISYKALAEAMLLEADDLNSEIELYVIDVIRAGLIEAKLNQLEESIVITRSTQRSFDKSQWQKLAEEFAKWNNSLESVANIVQGAIDSSLDSSNPTLPPVAAKN